MEIENHKCDAEKPVTENETSSLSDEQLTVITAVKDGKNIFITGSAGVGKSFVLKEVIKILPRSETYVTASTGVAACNVNGTTLHSFAAIGLGEAPVDRLCGKIFRSKDAITRWRKCRILIIDEISMIDGDLFDKVEEVARRVRKNNNPFGGIQLVLCGDFLQLPPVTVQGKPKTFCFESFAWKKCVQVTIVLKKVFRQKDSLFIGLLNRLRVGEVTRKDAAQLQKCKFTKFNEEDGIKPTLLFPHRCSCDRVNEDELRKLPEEKVTYMSEDEIHREEYRDMLRKNSRYPEALELRVGAQVMLLKNVNVTCGLVNGARGVVIDFEMKNPQLKEVEEKPKMKELIENLKNEENADFRKYPVVKFTNGMTLLVTPEKQSIEVAGIEVAYRVQLPLALAWAVSIHKAQGMTLDRVDLSLNKVFEFGQAYVALSRVTGLSGLFLRDFNVAKVKAHPKVLAYYKQLEGGQSTTNSFSQSISFSDSSSFSQRTSFSDTMKQAPVSSQPSFRNNTWRKSQTGNNTDLYLKRNHASAFGSCSWPSTLNFHKGFGHSGSQGPSSLHNGDYEAVLAKRPCFSSSQIGHSNNSVATKSSPETCATNSACEASPVRVTRKKRLPLIVIDSDSE